MYQNSSHSPVHLSGKPAPAPAPAHEPPLPRGECAFIVPESPANGPRRRCSCRSFYPDSLVRSRCGCGHQAWHHESQPVSAVTMDDYLQALEQMKWLRHQVKRLEGLEQRCKQELFQERMAREDLVRTSRAVQARMYDNMRMLKISMDDRIEAVVDKTTEFGDQLQGMQERLIMLDDVTMDLENRLDRVEHLAPVSRRTTPAASTPRPHTGTPTTTPVPQLAPLMHPQPHHPLGQLPIRTDKKYPLSWSVRVVFVLRKSQPFAFDPDSNAYKRCLSRKLHQHLDFPAHDSSCFANRIDNAFKAVFRGRPWMPLTGHRPADEPLGRMALTLLPPDLIHRDVWDYPFLEDHCIAHDKMQGDLLYITLQYEHVTWNEIRSLPAVSSVDPSCWNHDDELDGTVEYKTLNSDIMYDYQDPPPTYSSRTHSLADRAPSKLHVLADSAARLSPIGRAQSQSSSHSSTLSPMQRIPTQSSSHISESRFSSERGSLRSFETETTNDEHLDKKPKLRSRPSMPHIMNGHAQQPMYISGRSKRKMPVREKGPKEPLHFNASNLARWARPNLLHPHSSKGKETAQGP
ncbi:hypothetical protein ACEQ8H_005248 [Pleosporales sp. CAS-2024a]